MPNSRHNGWSGIIQEINMGARHNGWSGTGLIGAGFGKGGNVDGGSGGLPDVGQEYPPPDPDYIPTGKDGWINIPDGHWQGYTGGGVYSDGNIWNARYEGFVGWNDSLVYDGIDPLGDVAGTAGFTPPIVPASIRWKMLSGFNDQRPRQLSDYDGAVRMNHTDTKTTLELYRQAWGNKGIKYPVTNRYREEGLRFIITALDSDSPQNVATGYTAIHSQGGNETFHETVDIILGDASGSAGITNLTAFGSGRVSIGSLTGNEVWDVSLTEGNGALTLNGSSGAGLLTGLTNPVWEIGLHNEDMRPLPNVTGTTGFSLTFDEAWVACGKTSGNYQANTIQIVLYADSTNYLPDMKQCILFELEIRN